MAKKKLRQGYFKEMAPPRLRQIDDAAEIYVERRDERIKCNAEEKTAKDFLIDVMKQAGLHRYETPDGMVVEVTAASNVKCRRKDEPEQGEEDAE